MKCYSKDNNSNGESGNCDCSVGRYGNMVLVARVVVWWQGLQTVVVIIVELVAMIMMGCYPIIKLDAD